MYSLESPHRGDSNEYPQYNIIVKKLEKMFQNYRHFASLSGVMINLQWLELPISRTNFHGPKDVRALRFDYMLVTTVGAEGEDWDPVKLGKLIKPVHSLWYFLLNIL